MHAGAGAGRALDDEKSPRLPHDAMHRRQPETTAAGVTLGGEEGLENPPELLRRDAVPGIGDGERDIAPRRDRLGADGFLREQGEMPARQRQAPTLRHGIAGVDREIDQHLIELRGIDPHMPPRLLEFEGEDDVPPEQAHEHRRDAAHRLVHRDDFGLQRLLAGESEQLPHQRRAARDRALDLHDRRTARRFLRGRLRRAADRGQEIVEIMRDAAGEQADRLEFADMRDLLLQAMDRRQVEQREGQPAHRAIRLAQRGAADLDAARRRAEQGRAPACRVEIAAESGREITPERLAFGGREQGQRRCRKARASIGDKAPEPGTGAENAPLAVENGEGHGIEVEHHAEQRRRLATRRRQAIEPPPRRE